MSEVWDEGSFHSAHHVGVYSSAPQPDSDSRLLSKIAMDDQEGWCTMEFWLGVGIGFVGAIVICAVGGAVILVRTTREIVDDATLANKAEWRKREP